MKRSPGKQCSVETCDRPSRARGMCTRHYGQVMTKGYTYELESFDVCQIDGCARQPRSTHARYCEMHYYRIRRNGTPEIVAKRVPDQQCSVEGCVNKAFHTDGTCRTCRLRMRRNGDYDYHNRGSKSHNWLSDDELGYKEAHRRVKRARGSASTHRCVDCGGAALHWSYNHAAKDEKWGRHEDGILVPFSTNVEDYEPRCVPCHKRFDLRIAREAK